MTKMSDVYKSIADNSLLPLLRKIVSLKTKISSGVTLSVDEIKELYKFKSFFDSNNFQIPEPTGVANKANTVHAPQRFGTHAQNPAIDYSAPKPSAPPAATNHGHKLGTTVVSVGGSQYNSYNKEVVTNPDTRSNLDRVDDVIYQQSKEWLRKLDFIRSTRDSYVFVDINDDDCDSFEIVEKKEDKKADASENTQPNNAEPETDTKSEDMEMVEIYSGNQGNGIITLEDEIAKHASQFKNREVLMRQAQMKYFSPLTNPITVNPMVHSYC